MKAPRRFWSDSDFNRLAELYPARPTKEVATLINRSVPAVNCAAAKLGIKKTPEYLKAECGLPKGCEIGREYRFKPGHVPANKGLRRPGWNRGGMRETQFKKGERRGNAAKNWVPIGTIRPDPEGYLRIKLRDAEYGKEPTGYGNSKVWPMYSRYVWEQHKGPIPPKHLVIFKDTDRRNCAIENLELISMADNARRNAMWNRLPREVIEAIQLNGVLKKKIRSLHG